MKRIKNARKKKGFTLKQIASLMGRDESTVQRYEAAKIGDVKVSVVLEFSRILGISPAYLLGLTDNDNEFTKDLAILKQYNIEGSISDDRNIVSFFSESIKNLVDSSLFYVQMEDDSMSPTIPLNGLVLVVDDKKVDDGEIVVVHCVTEKQIIIGRATKQSEIMIVSPDNPEYPPVVLTPTLDFNIIGKASLVRYSV